MFEASPGAILVAGIGLGLVMRWVDSFNDPPTPEEETVWGRVLIRAAAKIRQKVEVPAPSLSLMPEIKYTLKEPVLVERAAPAPEREAALR